MKLKVVKEVQTDSNINIKVFVDEKLLSEEGCENSNNGFVFPFLGKTNTRLLFELINIENVETFEFHLSDVDHLLPEAVSSVAIIITNGIVSICPCFSNESLYLIPTWHPRLIIQHLKQIAYNNSFSLEIEKEGEWTDEDCLSLNYVKEFTKTVGAHFNEAMEATEDLIEKVKISMAESFMKNLHNFENNVIELSFDFPDHIKTPCKQYLLYFSQFLSDLGIEASTSILEEVQKVLFRISPKNKEEAIQQIKKALDAYLNAPSIVNIENEIMLSSNDIAAQQWMANVMHLKTQLLLSQSIIQAKNAAIETLELNNYRYKQMLVEHDKSDEKKEKILSGVVTIEEYKGKGFSINLAEILRMLKRKLSK